MPKIKSKFKTQNSKSTKIKLDIEKSVMQKIKTDKVKMKPRWYFIIGTPFTFLGLIGLSMGAIFLTNLIFFLVRRRAGMGYWRLEIILESFPLWIPVIAVLLIISGVWFLRRYDFSYKKNFLLIIITFVFSIIISAWLIDRLGINEVWSRQGQMRRFYQQLENQDKALPHWQNKMKVDRNKFFYN